VHDVVDEGTTSDNVAHGVAFGVTGTGIFPRFVCRVNRAQVPQQQMKTRGLRSRKGV
jgi:hypothetical protein